LSCDRCFLKEFCESTKQHYISRNFFRKTRERVAKELEKFCPLKVVIDELVREQWMRIIHDLAASRKIVFEWRD